MPRSRLNRTKPESSIGVVVPIGSSEARSSVSSTEASSTDLAEVAVGLPPLLTIEDAAELIRIGRSLAYQLAHRYEVSGGLEGLPVLRFGTRLRVPRWALIERITTGRLVQLNVEAGD